MAESSHHTAFTEDGLRSGSQKFTSSGATGSKKPTSSGGNSSS